MYLGIDIGGTKTLVATLSDSGDIIASRRFPTNPDYDQFLGDLGANLKELDVPDDGIRACAAVPGLIDRNSGMVHALGNLPWRDKPIRDDISKLIGNQPVTLENDAKLAGLSEALLIKDSYSNVLFFTVSTGLGGSLIQDGRIVTALQDMEAGKMPLMHEGKLQYWEDFASGRSVVERFGKKAADITDPAEWQSIGEALAYGLAAVCSVLQPEVIILGGSVGAYADNYSGTILEYLDKHLYAIIRRPKAVLAAQRPNEAVIYGCYALLRQTEDNPAETA